MLPAPSAVMLPMTPIVSPVGAKPENSTANGPSSIAIGEAIIVNVSLDGPTWLSDGVAVIVTELGLGGVAGAWYITELEKPLFMAFERVPAPDDGDMLQLIPAA